MELNFFGGKADPSGRSDRAYGFVSALILQELFFWKYPKIPFSCISMPGRAKVHLTWIFYGLGFLIYSRGLSVLEHTLIKRRGGYALLIGIPAVISILLWIYQNNFLYRHRRIVYEDVPDTILISL